MRVEIVQQGTEQQCKKEKEWSHQWTEVSRRIDVRPFAILLANGTKLRVHADERTFLVDELQKMPTDRNSQQRTCVAELTRGESVYAAGDLVFGTPDKSAGGAKDHDSARVSYEMRAPRDNGQLLISSEPLGKRYKERARWHLKALLWFLIVDGIVHGVLYLGYYMRLFYGQRTQMHVVSMRIISKGGRKGGSTRLLIIGARALPGGIDGDRVFDDASYETYRRVKVGDYIPFIDVPHWPTMRQLGDRPSLHTFFGVVGTILALGLFLFWRIDRESSRPWYAQQPFVEEATGRLP